MVGLYFTSLVGRLTSGILKSRVMNGYKPKLVCIQEEEK